MKKIFGLLLICSLLTGLFTSCNSNHKNTTLKIAAAASLEKVYKEELIPLFEKKYPELKIEATYDGSGKLQTQIEAGMEIDVFMSAASKNTQALVEKKLIEQSKLFPLLKNELVVITSNTSNFKISSFQEILKAKTIALGDPNSVPAGMYSKEVFTNLGLWSQIENKISLGTSVTEVLASVSHGSAEVGIVYKTDVKQLSDKVKIIATIPKTSLQTPIIYPVAILKNSKNPKEAQLFVDFLKSKEALSIFKKHGFAPTV